MSLDTVTDVDRLRTLVAELDRLLAVPDLKAAVNPDGTPGHVVAGELIESAWGNAVVDTLNRTGLRVSYAGSATLVALPGPLVLQNTVVVTTDATGLANVTFRYPFTATPLVVMVQNGDINLFHLPILDAATVTTTGFRVKVFNFIADTGAGSTATAVYFLAIGQRA